MKICYLAGVGDIHTLKWVNYFAGKGHEVHIITNSLSSGRLGEGYSECVYFHLLTTLIPQHRVRSGYVNIPLQFIQVRRLINRIKPDVVHVHYLAIRALMAITSGFHPAVLTAWGSDILITPKKSRLQKFLTQYALKRADLITCSGENLKKEMIKLGADHVKIRIIHHGVDTQEFNPQRGREFRDKLGLRGVPVVISIRKLKPIYNVEMLIRAVPLVLEHEPQASFIIAGDGEQKKYLERLATSLGVSENVRFVGWVPHDELPNYLASADVYISTSLSDGASISLQEAMACEVPPVVTGIPANREWIKDGENGFLVPIDDMQAMADRIVYLIRNKEVREKWGKEGRKIIKERAEYEEEMSKMEKIYEGMVRSQKFSRKKFKWLIWKSYTNN